VADIEVKDSRLGLGGSFTSVFKIFSPRDVSTRKCVFETDYAKLAPMIKDALVKKAAAVETAGDQPKYKLPEGKKPMYTGDVWVFAEQEGGEINPASFELLGKATELAKNLNEKVGAVLVGKDMQKLAPQLISYGADKVYIIDNDLLKDFLPVPYTKAVASLIEKYHPQMMLFSATPLGRELGPRIAYRTNSGLTADCTGLDIFDHKKGSQELIGILRQTRPALGGNIMASIISQNAKVQMSTVRPGVMHANKPDPSRKAEIINFEPELVPADAGVRIVSTEIKPPSSELSEATVIVAGGGGCKTKEGFERCIPSLAEHLGKYLGQKAQVGASRVAVEYGFIDRSHQVGQTGQTVKPRIYVAAGISGAVQHLTGMQNSDVIIAINKDPNARIFKAADFGIVGNLEEVIPELIKALDAQGV
jgi:electron transfer flavoprotein alpha subunit